MWRGNHSKLLVLASAHIMLSSTLAHDSESVGLKTPLVAQQILFHLKNHSRRHSSHPFGIACSLNTRFGEKNLN